ncbi:expressed unknown protein [Seminavis robusta]|uniref:Uncharacterized protein n=1 Tax=Seminavis robusta TaxID=568900 RepID=A0A9N8E9T7_9STRA|nr:expressed unknown protein [Seminavis robusta]|eukprot:Sro814_g206380.1 n/a (709) ;mRNA; f:34458-36701
MTLDSDDDSDDELLKDLFAGSSSSRRKQRNEEKKVAKGFELLDQCMADAARIKAKDDRIAEIKREETQTSETDMIAKTEEMVANAKKQPTRHENKDHMEGSLEDLEHVLSRARCLELGKAFNTNSVVTLGARRTMVFHTQQQQQQQSHKMYFFDTATTTPTQYLVQLKKILRQLVSFKQKSLQSAWIQPLRNSTKDVGLFQTFLETHMLAKARQQAGFSQIPQEIVRWLLQVACSSDGDVATTVPFRNGAMITLQGLLRQNKHMQTETKENLRPACFDLSQLTVQLQCWVSTIISTDEEITKDDNQNDTEPIAKEYNHNARGLERLLILWNSAFDSDQVSTEGKEVAAKDAIHCLALLVKLSLDKEAVHSTETNFRLTRHLQTIMSKIIHFVTRQLENDEARLSAWTKDAAVAIMSELVQSQLGPGEEEAEDDDDTNGWLCLALACRMLPTTTIKRKQQQQQSLLVAQLKARVCLEALRHLIGQEWEEQVYEAVAKYQKSQKDSTASCDLVSKAKNHLKWLVLCSTLTALVKLNETPSKDMANDTAKCLAIAEVALGRCLDVGMELMKAAENDENHNDLDDEDDPNTKKSYNEYRTKDDARAVATLLGFVEVECNKLSTLMNAGMMTPHFQRVGYLVQCHLKYIMEAQPNASHHGGQSVKTVVAKQSTMDRWIKRGVDASYDDDNDDESAESPCKKQRTVLGAAENKP